MNRISRYVWLICIGIMAILANVAGVLVIIESWHSIGHIYFNTCGGVESPIQVLLVLLITPVIAGAWATFLLKDRAEAQTFLSTGTVTGIVVSFFMVVPVMWLSLSNDIVHLWNNLFLALISALTILAGTITGAWIVTRHVSGDDKNGKTAVLVLLLAATLSWVGLYVLPQLLVIAVKELRF